MMDNGLGRELTVQTPIETDWHKHGGLPSGTQAPVFFFVKKTGLFPWSLRIAVDHDALGRIRHLID